MSKPFVTERFVIPDSIKNQLHSIESRFGFGEFGKAVYYRTYSRKKSDGSQEQWSDTIIRVIEGLFSIRKDYFIRNRLGWNDEEWYEFASKMGHSMVKMEVLPPGRGKREKRKSTRVKIIIHSKRQGLWAMGTDFIYERGGAALYNCGFATTSDFIMGVEWSMDMLMCGCGVGFDTVWRGKVYKPDKENQVGFVIPDSREGWVASVVRLMKGLFGESTLGPNTRSP